MGKQGVVTVTRTTVTNQGKGNGQKTVVHVPPHTRVVAGKTIFVAGYTYTR